MSSYIEDVSFRRLLLKSLTRNRIGYYEWRINIKAIVENFARMSDAVSGPPFIKPCLFIRGGLSDHLPDSGWAQGREYFPSAKLVTVPGAGHWVHAEKPEEFVSAVLDFLSGVKP